ncbi:GTP cyclohydrolase, FolE2/MptA family [Desulforegula conservatrix]|uniref:GTP cyclohydrolase, FolE2/MptA family n=1 Tax=Desulforegula conservatrix TaxID=153026 RepID=UPI0004890C93|nr:GTP cyclohydrolase, FolE2/MptA family [Desulforegula conservatrix]
MENFSGFFYRDKESGASSLKYIPESEHKRILNTSEDIPEQAPSFPLFLDEVGISNKTLWISLPEGLIPFEATITVSLPPDSRGIHMSRMEGAISELHGVLFESPTVYAEELARKIGEKQTGDKVSVNLSGKIPLIQTTTASRNKSIDSVMIDISVSGLKKDENLKLETVLSAGMDHITACPCTQEYNRALFNTESSKCLPTHSQRSSTRLAVRVSNGYPEWKDLVTCIKSALHTTNDLLKRNDEAEIVLKSHSAPQFAEDAARETARAAGRIMGGKLSSDTPVKIESLSLESIHTHNVWCKVSTTMGRITEIENSLKKSDS